MRIGVFHQLNKGGRRITFDTKMSSRLQQLEQQLTSIRTAIEALPEGKLICARNGNYTKWLQSDGHHNTYIPRKNRALAEQLAIKKYLFAQEQDLLQEKQAIEAYRKLHKEEKQAEQLLNSDSGYAPLLAPYFQPFSQELQQWVVEPYEQCRNHPEHLIHKSSAGIMVRSKSEALIVMLLHIYHIPFRYECALNLSGNLIYPDFTVRHPKTGDLFYWEHFGMMDDPAYSEKAFHKLQLYASHGIYPFDQLITTYETGNHPLDSTLADELVKYYFL